MLITVVVGKVTPIAVNPVQVKPLAAPASLNLTINVCPSVGVPVKVNVVAFATALKSYTSVISVLITAVASSVVVTTLFVILLLVRVLVLEIEGITTPSTANTPAALLANVVSLACPNSIFPVVVILFTTILGVPVKAVATVLSPVFVPEVFASLVLLVESKLTFESLSPCAVNPAKPPAGIATPFLSVLESAPSHCGKYKSVLVAGPTTSPEPALGSSLIHFDEAVS